MVIYEQPETSWKNSFQPNRLWGRANLESITEDTNSSDNLMLSTRMIKKNKIFKMLQVNNSYEEQFDII